MNWGDINSNLLNYIILLALFRINNNNNKNLKRFKKHFKRV